MAQATTTAAARVSTCLRLSIARDVSGIRSNMPARTLPKNHSSKSPFLVCSSFAPGSSLDERVEYHVHGRCHRKKVPVPTEDEDEAIQCLVKMGFPFSSPVMAAGIEWR